MSKIPRTDTLKIPSEALLLLGQKGVPEQIVTAILVLGDHARQLERELSRFEAAEAKLPKPVIYYDPSGKKTHMHSTRYFVFFQDYHDVYSTAVKAIAEREELRTEVESLRKDAERYRWLRKRYSAADADYRDFGLKEQRGRSVAIFSVPDPWPFSFDYEKAAELMDAAIDAALQEGEKCTSKL